MGDLGLDVGSADYRFRVGAANLSNMHGAASVAAVTAGNGSMVA